MHMRLPSLSLLVLLVLPSVLAAGPALAELDVAGGDLAGRVHVAGHLRAYVDERGGLGVEEGLPGLRLRAEALQVTLHHRNFTTVADYGVDPLEPPPPRTSTHRDAVVRSEQARGGYSVGVLPLRPDHPVDVALGGGCGTFSPPDRQGTSVRDHVRGDPVEGDAPSYWAPVGDALRWDACPGTMTVTGDLRIVLWRVDVRVWDDEGVWSYRSGTEEKTLVPGVARTETRRQLVLDATNATLELGVPDDGGALHVAAPRVDVAGRLSLQDARGRVAAGDGWSTLQGSTPTFEGVFSLRGAPEAGRVRVVLLDASGDGAGGLPAPGLPGGLLLAWAVAAAVVLALAAAVRRRHGPRLAVRLHGVASDAARTQRFVRASLLAHAAVWADPTHGDGYVLRALARGSRRRWAAALRDHTRAHHRLGGRLRGLNAFEAARVCSVRGRAAEAAHWLTIAVRHDVRLLDEAAMDPDFGRVVGHAVFRRVMGGHLPDAGAVA